MLGGRVAVIETELKIALDAAAEARLAKHPALAELRQTPRRSQTLVSTYYDTDGHALAAAGIALRLRKQGRRWVQTIKLGGETAGPGLFARREIERPAPGGRLALEGPDPVYAAVAKVTGGAELAPVFETRVRRRIERLSAPGGGTVELALDRGEIVAGSARAAILEAELELVEGEVGALYALARRLFAQGPIRFETGSKSARGYALARGIAGADAAPQPRKAGRMDFLADATVETAARDVLRDCLAQIAANLALTADSDEPEGPHQLRIGLRRLRTAFKAFESILGGPAMEPLAAAARDLGRIVGGLRDLDVAIGEMLPEAAGLGLDAAARSGLEAALDARRAGLRAKVRGALADAGTVGFVFDLAAFVEARGWLVAADWAQSGRLATPIGALAADILEHRHRKVLGRGRRIDRLDAEGLHALRKELKTLRYTAEMLAPVFPGKPAARYLKTLKALQESFGSLNDAATAQTLMAGTEALGAGNPVLIRGAGWIAGALAVRVRSDRPTLAARWKGFAAAEPYWR